MNWDSAQQLFRIGLQFGAGILVSRGVITADMAQQAVGAMLSLGGIAWWAFWQRKRLN